MLVLCGRAQRRDDRLQLRLRDLERANRRGDLCGAVREKVGEGDEGREEPEGEEGEEGALEAERAADEGREDKDGEEEEEGREGDVED